TARELANRIAHGTVDNSAAGDRWAQFMPLSKQSTAPNGCLAIQFESRPTLSTFAPTPGRARESGPFWCQRLISHRLHPVDGPGGDRTLTDRKAGALAHPFAKCIIFGNDLWQLARANGPKRRRPKRLPQDLNA